MMIVLRKSILRASESVILPSSRIWRSRCITSGCAFSISSKSTTLYGRRRTWIEAFHSSGWGGTLEETFDWLLPWLRSGATLYNPHAVYYTTKGGWWEWAPPSTDWRQPYWRHHRVFADAVTTPIVRNRHGDSSGVRGAAWLWPPPGQDFGASATS